MNPDDDKLMFCPFLITTVHNTRFNGYAGELRNTVQRMQPCVKEKCMAFNLKDRSCKQFETSHKSR